MRAEMAATENLEGVEDPGSVTAADSAAPVERKPLFTPPKFREDLRALPGMLRTTPLLFLPLVLLLVGFPLFVMVQNNSLAPEVAGIAAYYVQFFFLPPALFTFFIAGFFAPRAAYLVGFIYGIIASVIWTIALLMVGPVAAEPGTPAASPDPFVVLGTTLVYGLLYGTLAAALASWYRQFLRGISERGRERRAQRELDERAKRRDQRQEARRVAKQRS
jgi:hypothetical protein